LKPIQTNEIDGFGRIPKAFAKLPVSVEQGVITGQALVDLLDHAKSDGYAIPGVNNVGSNSIMHGSCSQIRWPYYDHLLQGGGQLIAGKAADNTDDKAFIAVAVTGKNHVRSVAEICGVPIVLDTDHCQKA